jgi:hypothetical protein
MLQTTSSLGSCLLPQGSPRHWYLHTKPHSVISQKIVISIMTAVNLKSYQGNRNLNSVKKHIPYLRSAFSYKEELKITFMIKYYVVCFVCIENTERINTMNFMFLDIIHHPAFFGDWILLGPTE